MSGAHEHPGARLRRLMDDHCVGLPGAFNGMVARIARDAGFEGLYVSGAAVTASYGVPDIGLLTLNEFCSVIRQVTQASGLPVIGARLPPIAGWVEPGRNGLLFEPGSARELARRLAWAEAFPERMRQMGECAQADYHARFIADWGWQRLFGDRRRQPRMSWS